MKKASKPAVRRSTPQRELILQALKNSHIHPTAAQIHKMVSKKKPAISLGTVYRNLEVLEQDGCILRLKTKGKDSRYDGCTSSHCHLFCQSCGRVQDIFDVSKVAVESKSLKKKQFQVQYNFLELHGTCKKCQSLNNK
jgi:Fe2+ or Zn2+ uptake regulation protein